VEENVFIFRAYNLSDINVVWKSVDDELYVYGGLLSSHVLIQFFLIPIKT